jgi:hypothetical protein
VVKVYFFYTFTMPPKPPLQPQLDSLSVKVGSWFEAHATGRGVVAIPIVVLVIAIAAAVRFLLES